MASILEICQDSSELMGLGSPTAIYTSTDKYSTELSQIANEAATYIMKQHDWRLLTTLKTQAGDGTTTDFSLPSDYDRMPVKAQIFRASTKRPMVQILDLDTWLENRLVSISSLEGEWIILGGNLVTYPVMASTDSAKFYYISNKYAANSGGTAQAAFTSDADTFRLDDRLLKLAIIWRWRFMKGLEYADDMQNFEIAFAQEIARDKGSRILKIGRHRLLDGVSWAYPGVISA